MDEGLSRLLLRHQRIVLGLGAQIRVATARPREIGGEGFTLGEHVEQRSRADMEFAAVKRSPAI